MKIPKEKFVEIMHLFKEQYKKERELSLALKCLVDGYPVIILTETINAKFIELLEELMMDNDKFISWWMYEVDFGNKADRVYISDINKKIIKFHTAEQLYDYLALNL